MYRNNYIIPSNTNSMYPNSMNFKSNNPEERFLFPFVVGGLAGTAFGYGLSNRRPNYYPTPQPNFIYPFR